MTNTHITRAYRGLLRELVKSSILHRSSRNRAISANLRTFLMESMSREQNRSMALRDVENTITFLRADTNHKALLERYSSYHGLTEQEKIRATARRVGLETPITNTP